MKKLLKYFFLFTTLLLFTSCFDIIDKVALKANGTGSYTIILNASKSKTRIASLSKMGKVNGKTIPTKAEIQKKVAEAALTFKSVSGISAVQTNVDLDNYIIKLSCNFQKIENINEGIAKLKSKSIIGKMFPSQLFSNDPARKIFTKNKIDTRKSDYEKLSNADKEVFTTAKYTSILQFENSIKSQSNSAFVLAPNKKALKLDGTILDFIYQKKALQNTITFH